MHSMAVQVWTLCSSPKASCTRINANAFTYSGLSSIELPDSVTNVATAAFSHCQNLKTVKLSSGMTSLRKDASGYSGLGKH